MLDGFLSYRGLILFLEHSSHMLEEQQNSVFYMLDYVIYIMKLSFLLFRQKKGTLVSLFFANQLTVVRSPAANSVFCVLKILLA